MAMAIDVLGFVLGISPTLYMAYLCVASLWTVATMEIPAPTIRPMGLVCAMIGLSMVSFVITPLPFVLSWLARRLGSGKSGSLAQASLGFIAFPFLLGFFTLIAMTVICSIRGIEIGG